MIKVIRDFLILLILYYACIGAMLRHGGWTAVFLEENRDIKSGRTHYCYFQPSLFYKCKPQWHFLDMGVGVKITINEAD